MKEKFGDFQIKEKDGTWIITEPKLGGKQILKRLEMPIIGTSNMSQINVGTTKGCIKLKLKLKVLANTPFHLEEFRTSGGCYAPRRISRFDAGGSISRHAWGIAIDINTKSGYVPSAWL